MKTRGGWEAIKIWDVWAPLVRDLTGGFYAIHKPKTKDESPPIYHDRMGHAKSIFSINEPPNFNNEHPADIIDLE